MSEWKEYKLKDLGLLQRGRSRHRPRYAFHLYGGNYPFIQTGQIREASKYITQYEQTYSEEGLKQSKLWPKGTLCITIAANIAELGILGFDACFPDSVLGFIPDEKNVDLDFIFYTLTHFQRELKHIGEGSVQDNINLGTFEDLLFPIPPLPEQTAIASILSSLDDKIDLLHRQNATLEKMAETLFRQWFVEEAKEEWETYSLGSFISVKHGFAFKGEFISPEPTNFKLVTPGNFKIGGGFKSDKFKYYTKEDFPLEYIFKTNDLIVTMTDLSIDGDTLGYSALIPENHKNEIFLHNQRVGKIEFKRSISKYFVYYLMKTEDYQWFILSGASGTSIRHTSPTSIGSYKFKLPPKQIMDKFENICSDLQNKIRINQTQIRTLTALRDTLLPKLMSGEVRVSESGFAG